MKKLAPAFFILSLSAKLAFGDSTANLGIFSEQADIGNVARPGSVNFEPATGEYLIAGGGENMWLTNDAFHFVWVKMSGDLSPRGGHQVSGNKRKPPPQSLSDHPPVARSGFGLRRRRPARRRVDRASVPRNRRRHDA